MAVPVLNEGKKKKLVEFMLNCELHHVVDAYVEYPEARQLKVPMTGDTALHIAAYDGWEYYAQKMVSAAEAVELAIRNVQGDTALHLAAKYGNSFFCRCIAEKDVNLIGEPNESGETPLFCAVSRGRTKLFLYLYHLYSKRKGAVCLNKPEMYTRNDGDTILHSAISGEHFDLAYIIINKYPRLVNQPNKDGTFPLHILATKPSAFPSALRLFLIREFFYHCVYVGKLENKLDLAKRPPTPQLRWNALYRPLKARGLFNVVHFYAKLPQKVMFCNRKPEDLRKKDEETAAKVQVDHQNNQQDEETTNNNQGYGEIDEESANGQDHPTIKSRVMPKRGCWYYSCYYIAVLLFALPLGIIALCGFSLIFIYFCIGCVLVCCVTVYYFVLLLLRISYLLAKNLSGYNEYVRIKRMKERCIWSTEVMNKLIESEQSLDHFMPPKQEHQPLVPTIKVKNDVIESENTHRQSEMQPNPLNKEGQSLEATVELGMQPKPPKEEDKSAQAKIKKLESPILIAAKHGISDMVLRILNLKPDAIFEVNAEEKNILMLAVEHRHHHLYYNLMNNGRINKTVLERVDKDGNNLLHIAANLEAGKQFWDTRGAALNLHMELKWYLTIMKSMPHHLVVGYNKKKRTPSQILHQSHRALIKEGREWLTNTSQSCSLVAALIATVTFAASATVPGGLKQDIGVPTLEHKPIFIISAVSSLIALSFSMVSVVMFLAILTSSFKLEDFSLDLPFKLLWGLITLIVSIVSMIISFYAGHCFVLKQEFNHSAALVYEITCSLLVVFIISKFPLDFEIVWTTVRIMPFGVHLSLQEKR